MRITTLLGSAKKNGNAASVIGWVEENLKSHGHAVKRIYFNNKSTGAVLGVPNVGRIPMK